MNEYLGIYFVI
ncbi:hypothetical protein YPPY34_0972, partial [Yersinia pestis PY-34]